MSDDTTHKDKRQGKKSPHKVGYASPPLHSQFKPKMSGNPSGRPKSSKVRNIHPSLVDVYLQEFKIGEGRSRRSVPAIIVLHEKLLRQAFKGDTKAIALVAKFARELGVINFKDEVKANLSTLTPEERAIMDKAWPIVQKLRASRN